MRWPGRVARTGETINAYKINIKTDLNRYRVRGCGLLSSHSALGSVIGSCEQGNDLWGSMKSGKFLD